MTGLMQRTLTQCGILCRIYKHVAASISKIGLVVLYALNGIYLIIPYRRRKETKCWLLLQYLTVSLFHLHS